MMPPTLRAARAALLLATVPATLHGQQSLYPQASAMTGVEVRQYGFGSKFPLDHVRQVAVPIAVAVPLGQRFSFDIGAWWASTNTKSSTGDDTFSSFTDTQLRLAYVLGSEAVVASVMVNLPTGKETTTQQQFGVAANASSNFLLFPVNTYGSGTSVTPGLAAATTVGDWNLGLAASVRWSAKYQPFSDSGNSALRYKPGVETRIRAGIDHLVGRGRFALGGTFSTFASDELSGTGLTSGTFDPGNRFLVDASLVSPVGNGSVSVYAWNYHRTTSNSADTTSGSSAGGKENIFTAGLSGSFPLGTSASFEPLVEGRFWSPEVGSGSLFGFGAGLRYQLSPAIALVPSARIDVGTIKTAVSNGSSSVFGWDVSALLRYTF
jgi:hypothetical protein